MIRFIAVSVFLLFALPALALDDIELPPGFSIEEVAEIPNARSLALGDNGTVYVSTRRGQSVYAAVPDGDKFRVVEIDSGLTTPNGIAFYDGDLYVAEVERVLRYNDIADNLQSDPEPEVLDISLPGERHHGWRYIGFGPDGWLFVSIGVPCNVCDEEGFGRIVRFNLDTGEQDTWAFGVRNSVGLTWHPDTGDLWFTDNGRDMLGDDLPPGELNHSSEQGQHFGFPFCHAGEILDPKFGAGEDCGDYRGPAQKLGPHVAPLGLAFYTGEMFPAEYRGHVFIAEHGSWNRSEKIGYRVTLVRLDGDKAVSYEPFASGWLQRDEARETVSGRPVDVLVLPDGSLLVSDDHAGRLYRIRYDATQEQS